MNPIDRRYFKMAVGESRIRSETPKDITARCPICGDSKISKNKARLHLYEKNGVTLVNCFNECPCVNKTVYNFLKEFYPGLLEGYKRETFGSRLETLKELNFNGLVGDWETPKIDGSSKPPVLFGINAFKKSERVYDYIESRGLEWFPELGEIFEGVPITIDQKFFNIKDFIIIPLYCGDEWYAFYSRSLNEHRFQTYIPEKNEGWKLWNYFNIIKDEPLYIFEGIFDALSAYTHGLTNVVACLGATPPKERLNGLNCVFCLDNDRTGKLNSIKYLKQGYKAVCYPSSIHQKDANEMLQHGENVKEILINNVVEGILGEVKIKSTL